MHDWRKQVGRRGEDLAAAFLQTKGFTVIAKNWRCKAGEIDLIVERAGEIRFVEVKARSSLVYGYPEEAVTATKRQHLANAAECWLRVLPSLPKHYQIDVIAITWQDKRQPPAIVWIEQIV